MINDYTLNIVNEAKFAYMVNNTNHIDNVRLAIHSQGGARRINDSSNLLISSQRSQMSTSNKDFYKWIQPVPAPVGGQHK